ncbi:MAG: C4-dicarboxylate ABC transporter substrate-binding protein, partial [Spirochaetes bacterium]|nr:C4-dicarboxylate ABC transporter substrate-binding protein [Spirochaetota bacterium]
SEGAENEVLEQLAAEGATVVEVEDKSAWQEAVAGVVETAAAENAELYQQILDLQ